MSVHGGGQLTLDKWLSISSVQRPVSQCMEDCASGPVFDSGGGGY